MSETRTAMIEITKIAMEDGFNPRLTFDERALDELVASVREQGIVTALTVRSDGNGGYVLIAGARRLEAARRAGLSQVPAVIRTADGALAAAIAENLIRADLDPIEEARALQRLGEAEKLSTHKEIAARVGKSAAHVSERLRLLSLPGACQAQIAAGTVPVAAERDLRRVAKISPAVAEGVCELVERGEVEGRDLVDRFGEVLVALAEDEGAPTMIDTSGARLSEMVPDAERRSALAERLVAALPYQRSDEGPIHLEEAEIDAARAAGCLIEHTIDHGGWESTVAFICDAELAADLAVRAVERIERQAAELAEARAKLTGRSDDDGSAAAEDVEQARRAAREQAKEAAAAGRSFNLELGRKLVARRGAKSRKEHSLARARAVAALILADNDNLPARGLRLVLPQLQEVEAGTLKSGEAREKVTYAEPAACADYLAARIDEARSANEVLELLADALIAATLADERELPQSRRAHWWSRVGEDIEKLLASDIRSVRPRRRRRRAAK
jgi:ParB family chromosome partitioning protein